MLMLSKKGLITKQHGMIVVIREHDERSGGTIPF